MSIHYGESERGENPMDTKFTNPYESQAIPETKRETFINVMEFKGTKDEIEYQVATIIKESGKIATCNEIISETITDNEEGTIYHVSFTFQEITPRNNQYGWE